MTLEANVLRAQSLRSTPEGYEVDVHLAWYRSLPLSCVENISIKIAGKEVPSEQMRVRYLNRSLRLDELGELVDDWWFIQDPLTIDVACSDARESGAEVELEVELATRIPYVIIGPDMALVQRTRAIKEVTIQ